MTACRIKSGTAASATRAAVASSVRRVPSSGIATSAAAKVPTEAGKQSRSADPNLPQVADDVEGDEKARDHAIITMRASSSDMAWRCAVDFNGERAAQRCFLENVQARAGAQPDLRRDSAVSPASAR